jgi:hypothetical protein
MEREVLLGTLVVALATLAVLSFLVGPLLGGRLGGAGGAPAATPSSADPEVARLAGECRAMLGALDELRWDHDLGRLTDDDYQALRADYQRRALAVYQELAAAVARRTQDVEALVSRERTVLAAAPRGRRR